MFARKKTADVQTSLQRFCDLHRDAASRAKHFRLAIELLSPQDKCQLVDDFNFETFHLIDSLLLHPDLCVDAQLVYDAELALWTLEQMLCYAPELVGKGWQRNAIESILRRALLPRNLMAVRKIAIRLFLIWYQTLAVYGNTTVVLDNVFQCCLPYFPLRNRQPTDQILQAYCDNSSLLQAAESSLSNGNGFEPGPLRVTPIIGDNASMASSATGGGPESVGVRERAQTLQVYLDKFLEYCCRETMKIEWSDESKRLTCAKFILDRVILLYISEIFPDIENNGVDVFGGWEGDEEPVQLLDTADPVVIARYWLIRWMVNIAMAPMTENPAAGLLLYRQALLSSQKATNGLLTLMREAMQLPLACSNVIHKVIALARCWLLQRDFPPFVDSGLVSLKAWNSLLIHSLLSFFRSDYLRSSGDRLPAGISLTHSILTVVREFANPAAGGVLPRQPPVVVWAELIRRLSESVLLICSRTDAFGNATAGVFTRTLLSVAIYVRVIREVELDDEMWDDVWMVFKTAVWTQVIEQWSKCVDSMTRALILNLFAIDVSHFDGGSGTFCAETSSTGSSTTRQHGASARASIIERVAAETAGGAGSESGSVVGGEGGMPTGDDDHHSNSHHGGSDHGERGSNDKDFQGIIQSTGNVSLWLRSWMRVINLVDPIDNAHAAPPQQLQNGETRVTVNNNNTNNINNTFSHQREAVRTLARTMDALLRCGCADVLVQWLAARLLHDRSLIGEQPHAIAPLCAVLTRSGGAILPAVQRAYILLSLRACLLKNADGCAAGEDGDDGEVDSVSQLVFEQMPRMSVEELSVLSSATITTLQKLLRSAEFSARAVRVAILLCSNHAEVENILVSLLENPSADVDVASLVLCVNAMCIVIMERSDEHLFTRLSISVANHRQCRSILPIFCTNLFFLTRIGPSVALADVMQRAIFNASGLGIPPIVERSANDLKWQLCALSACYETLSDWRKMVECFAHADDVFFEGMLWQLALQYPLSGFSISQWNSQMPVVNGGAQLAINNYEQSKNTFLEADAAILSFAAVEQHSFLWSRTVVGRHCYTINALADEPEQQSEINTWLESLSKRDYCAFDDEPDGSTDSSGPQRADSFRDLPRPSACAASSAAVAGGEPLLRDTFADVAEMLRLIRATDLAAEPEPDRRLLDEMADARPPAHGKWRQFLSDFGFIEHSRDVPINFHRELRHLDSTMSREVHKMAVIFVGKDQEDKQSILSNTSASEAFNAFVDRLGWAVQIGASDFHGYAGGLPQGQRAPYYASANTELIFHVSTLLNGDIHQKMKHLGNDEVHVVWSEHSRAYRRDILSTRFCDVLLVLYPISATMLRVHIETQDASLTFGPLFDGAFIHVTLAPNLVRETVLNASRAYRNARLDCDRPNKHREKVFRETKLHLKHLPLADAIIRLYAPTPN